VLNAFLAATSFKFNTSNPTDATKLRASNTDIKLPRFAMKSNLMLLRFPRAQKRRRRVV
jgi:hypothetical protein